MCIISLYIVLSINECMKSKWKREIRLHHGIQTIFRCNSKRFGGFMCIKNNNELIIEELRNEKKNCRRKNIYGI